MFSGKERCQIFYLTKNHPPTGDYSVDVVCMLENVLQKARRGEILGIALAFVEGNNNVRIGIADGCAHSALLVAAVGALNFEIHSKWSAQ